MQQSLGRFLGVLDYDAHDHGLVAAVHCLLESVTLSVGLALLASFRSLLHC
jgi:hypothetical protein